MSTLQTVPKVHLLFKSEVPLHETLHCNNTQPHCVRAAIAADNLVDERPLWHMLWNLPIKFDSFAKQADKQQHASVLTCSDLTIACCFYNGVSALQIVPKIRLKFEPHIAVPETLFWANTQTHG